MKEHDFLQFEEDDAGKKGLDGKQVFVTKRINGKVTHNKANNVENEIGSVLGNDEIIIGLNRVPEPNRKEQENKTSNSPLFLLYNCSYNSSIII